MAKRSLYELKSHKICRCRGRKNRASCPTAGRPTPKGRIVGSADKCPQSESGRRTRQLSRSLSTEGGAVSFEDGHRLDGKKWYHVYTEVHMQAVKVGVREFRQRLASFLEADAPVAITRHGETVGFYIPTRRKPKDEDLTALRTAAARLEAMLEAAGVAEDELVEEFKRARRRNRKQ